MKNQKDKLPLFILLVSTVISISTSIYFSYNNKSLLYRDAKSHLNIARRVFFSQTPGLAQLGSIWLPFTHILMLPTIWIDKFYYSGLAGIIPSMLAFILLSITIHGVVYRYSHDRVASFLASAIIFTNPSLLYLQSAPMSELPLLITSTLSIYYLSKWLKNGNYEDIIYSSLFIFLATLTRYDAWFLFICEFAVIAVMSKISDLKNKNVEGHLFLFTFLGGFGIFLWCLYNQLIFHNFLNFALGQGSGSWDTKRVATSASQFAPTHNLSQSFQTYSWIVIDNAGIVFVIGTVLSIFTLLFIKKRAHWLALLLLCFLFLSPYLFNIISLYIGQSIALSKHLYPHQTYNFRYGSAVIPSVAFFLGMLASRGKIGKVLVLLLIFLQGFLFLSHPLDILTDANIGNIKSEKTVAKWIQEHPVKGPTLLSTLSHDPLLFESYIPMNKVIYEGNRYLWIKALRSPEKYVDRVVLKVSDTTNDGVRINLYGKKILQQYFYLSYNDRDYQVYDKKQSSH